MEWLDREEIMWAQRSKEMWLLNGDRNTKYSLVKQRKSKNTVVRIRNTDGSWLENYEDLETAVGDFFKDIYREASSSSRDFNPLLENLSIPTLTNDVSDVLIRPVLEGEIKNAVFQMGLYKSPGSDGLPASFYQHFWDIVAKDISMMVQHFFHSGYLLK